MKLFLTATRHQQRRVELVNWAAERRVHFIHLVYSKEIILRSNPLAKVGSYLSFVERPIKKGVSQLEDVLMRGLGFALAWRVRQAAGRSAYFKIGCKQ
jgi:hypothetical protein